MMTRTNTGKERKAALENGNLLQQQQRAFLWLKFKGKEMERRQP
jgi:uncharacterized protein YecT (DUF1311 family)